MSAAAVEVVAMVKVTEVFAELFQILYPCFVFLVLSPISSTFITLSTAVNPCKLENNILEAMYQGMLSKLYKKTKVG